MKDGSITIKNSKLHTKPKSIVPEYQEGYLNFIINAPSNGEFEFYIEIKPN